MCYFTGYRREFANVLVGRTMQMDGVLSLPAKTLRHQSKSASGPPQNRHTPPRRLTLALSYLHNRNRCLSGEIDTKLMVGGPFTGWTSSMQFQHFVLQCHARPCLSLEFCFKMVYCEAEYAHIVVKTCLKPFYVVQEFLP